MALLSAELSKRRSSMEKEIFYGNESFGNAEIEKEDMYYAFLARCPFMEGIFRLYFTHPSGFTRLGVMFPEKGALTLKRRISAHELGAGPAEGTLVLMPGDKIPEISSENTEETQSDAALSEPQGEKNPKTLSKPSDYSSDRWSECADASAMTTDEVLKPRLFPLSGVLYRYRSGGTELAIPAMQADAVSAVLALTRAENIRGRDYFIIALDRDGFPSPALYPSRL